MPSSRCLLAHSFINVVGASVLSTERKDRMLRIVDCILQAAIFFFSQFRMPCEGKTRTVATYCPASLLSLSASTCHTIPCQVGGRSASSLCLTSLRGRTSIIEYLEQLVYPLVCRVASDTVYIDTHSTWARFLPAHPQASIKLELKSLLKGSSNSNQDSIDVGEIVR